MKKLKNKKVSWFLQFIYATWIRAIIKEAIRNDNSELDEKAMKLLDKLFKYKQ